MKNLDGTRTDPVYSLNHMTSYLPVLPVELYSTFYFLISAAKSRDHKNLLLDATAWWLCDLVQETFISVRVRD